MDRSQPARLRRVLVAALAAVLGTIVLIPGTASAAGTGTITGYGGKCVDVAGANTANGTQVQLWTCNGSGAQSWTVGTDGTIRALGKCLDVSGGSTANGAKIQLWDCNGSGAQQWVATAANDIVNPQTNKCLDATGVSSADGTPLQLWSCSGGANQKWTVPGGSNNGGGGGGFVVSSSVFNQMFPSRNSFYTYTGLTDAMTHFPAFATTGSDTVKKQEAAAFLANVSHETGGLVYIEEIDKSGNYCDTSQSYGCPAGTFAYYGRGPLQLSWNFNYYAAGNAIGQPLLNNPNLVSTNASISWQTALWYWMTGTGSAGTTSHNARVNSQGFGTTIRAINGIECNGGNTAEMQDRVNLYNRFVGLLGVPAGGNLTC